MTGATPDEWMLLAATITHVFGWLRTQTWEGLPGMLTLDTEVIVALIALSGLVTTSVVRGVYRLRRDRADAHRRAVEEAEQRAYTRARLEAVAREAEAALEAQQAENAELRRQLNTCSERGDT